MFGRHDGDLWVTRGPSQPVYHVPWAGQFSFVSGLRWCPDHDELIVTAVEHGRRPPDVRGGYRGDLALYRCSPADGRWHKVYDGYCHDPVCLAGGGYAVHRGGGITFLDREGSVERETKVGRFNWGPPSLSVSPDGSTVAWIRWKSDARKLSLDDVASGQSRQLATAIYNYGWLDSATVLYRLGAGPRLLDVATGRTRRFGHPLRDQIRAMADPPPDLAALAVLPADETWELYFGLQAVDDTVWLAAGLGARRSSEHANRATGLFRTDTAGTRIELAMAVAENELIEHFHALPDGSVVVKIAAYEDMTIVERRRIAIGPLVSFLDDGWHPVATSQTPAMGFHAMP